MVFNEIDDVVRSRMVYTYTDIDIVEMYVDYILEKVVKCSWQLSIIRVQWSCLNIVLQGNYYQLRGFFIRPFEPVS